MAMSKVVRDTPAKTCVFTKARGILLSREDYREKDRAEEGARGLAMASACCPPMTNATSNESLSSLP